MAHEEVLSTIRTVKLDTKRRLVVCLVMLPLLVKPGEARGGVFPQKTWERRTPRQVGLNLAELDAIQDYLEGRGCIVRHGYLVYTWGDFARRGDVASACKPWYTHFLFRAVEEGRISSVDLKVSEFEPRLNGINGGLDYKDRNITFRHMANQISCYGVKEGPGTAYDYNDWQIALFWDTLFTKVYRSTYETVDADVLHPKLTDILQCEDNPTFMAFGTGDRPGRVGVSPRDFARFGWLYLNKGDWKGRQLISEPHATMAATSPLPNSIPRTTAEEAELVEGQRTLGSRRVPDDQTDHKGSYSWLWWLNGVDRHGNRHWPDAPTDTYAALGHKNGMRGMAVLPSLDIVISWNDTTLDDRPSKPHPLNEALRLLCDAAADEPLDGQIMADPNNAAWLVYNRDYNGDGKLDPFFMCGPGDPEDFLYRGARNPDGTRSGDQTAIINKMKGTGANCLYFQAVRSHGGDGDDTHNPFVDCDPAKGLDEDVLNQWESWFSAMDDNGIVIYFFFYDDDTCIWDTGDTVGAEERVFIGGIVNRFEHHKHLIWCVAEEYQEAFSVQRAKNIAAAIRAADEHNHVIAVHKLNGLAFEELADDPNINQFAIQYNEPEPAVLHSGMVTAWNDAKGRYNLNMSEAADYGFDETARKKHWACAMGGAYVMAIRWTFESEDAPSVSDLETCGHLVRFFESTNVNEMAPHDELKHAGTEYLLALPGQSYIVYASNLSGALGVKDMVPGTYALTWLDTVKGTTIQQRQVAVDAGDQSWHPPQKLGDEVAVWINKIGNRR